MLILLITPSSFPNMNRTNRWLQKLEQYCARVMSGVYTVDR
jgi:hypothetical protein